MPSTAPPEDPALIRLRDLYDHLLPYVGTWRAEVIDGALVLRRRGMPEHRWIAARLLQDLMVTAETRGWCIYPNLSVVLPGTNQPCEPDGVVAPRNAPQLNGQEVFTDGLILVAEVVTPDSGDIERDKKPGIYARGGVPLMVLVDVEEAPPKVSVFSCPKDGSYTKRTTVHLGEEIHLPEPIDHTLDTAIFLEDSAYYRDWVAAGRPGPVTHEEAMRLLGVDVLSGAWVYPGGGGYDSVSTRVR